MMKKEKTSKIRQKLESFDDLCFDSYSAREITLIKRIISKIGLFSIENFNLQVYNFINEYEQRKETLNNKSKYNYINKLFYITPECLRNHYLKGEKQEVVKQYDTHIKHGRPRKISEKMEAELVNIVKESFDNNKPFSLSELNVFIESKYQISVNENYAHDLLNRHENELKIVEAIPMEEERHHIDAKIVDKFYTDLEKFIQTVHPSLIFNCDESSDKISKTCRKKKIIVPSNSDKTRYYYPVPPSGPHITFIAGIWTDLTFSKPMIIITRKTIEKELEEYGLPDGPLGYVAHSGTGYVQGDLFDKYIMQCFLPDLEQKRMLLGKKNLYGGIIMDGHKTHTHDDVIHLLTQNKVKILFIPPHSSHLLQPLDRLIFANWKRSMKRIKINKPYSDFSKRIIRGLKALQISCNAFDIKSAWERIGLMINIDNNAIKITINPNKVLSLLNIPLDDESDGDEFSSSEKQENDDKEESDCTDQYQVIKKRKIAKKCTQVLFPSSK